MTLQSNKEDTSDKFDNRESGCLKVQGEWMAPEQFGLVAGPL